MVCQTAFRRKSNIGPVGPTANHQQGWWFVTYMSQDGEGVNNINMGAQSDVINEPDAE